MMPSPASTARQSSSSGPASKVVFDLLDGPPRIRGDQVEQADRRRGEPHHGQGRVQDHGAQAGGGQQVLDKGLGQGHLFDFGLEFGV